MKQVSFEYGEGFLTTDLPDSAEIFIPGETVPDPPFLQDPIVETRHSIQNPIGMPKIAQLVHSGSKVTISFPDRVKGGFQETSHRKTSIPILIDECLKAGVQKQDIQLICSNGLHRKNTDDEIKALIGEQTWNEFQFTHQIINHDSEDWTNLVDLGKNEQGDPVIMNRDVFESDLPIMIGHVLGNPYGGYSGGYKMVSTGITHWKTIATSHNPQIMHRPDFTTVSPASLMRNKFNAIGRHMEMKMGRKFFMCDSVLDSKSRQIAVFSGFGEKVQSVAWQTANRRTYIPWAEEKFDVLMFGMPQVFHYGNGHGTNPILILQAIAANIIRHRRVMKNRFVVICSSLCNGYFNDQEFPSYRELYESFLIDGNNVLPDLERFAEAHCQSADYIDKYRFHFGYHPYHAFSMISCGHIAEMTASAIYIVGAEEPGYARAMGLKTRSGFQEALRDAGRIVGSNPKILALPKCFTTAAVHLMMKDDKIPDY